MYLYRNSKKTLGGHFSPFREVTRLLTLHSQTERVTYWVQEHPEGRPGLVIGLASTDAEYVTFSVVKIINFKIKMHLFGYVAIGPRRCNEVLDSLKNQSRKGIVHQVDVRGVTRRRIYRDASEGRVERCELVGVGAVKRDQMQSWVLHRATLRRTSI
jgi:hypothetical protein